MFAKASPRKASSGDGELLAANVQNIQALITAVAFHHQKPVRASPPGVQLRLRSKHTADDMLESPDVKHWIVQISPSVESLGQIFQEPLLRKPRKMDGRGQVRCVWKQGVKMPDAKSVKIADNFGAVGIGVDNSKDAAEQCAAFRLCNGKQYGPFNCRMRPAPAIANPKLVVQSLRPIAAYGPVHAIVLKTIAPFLIQENTICLKAICHPVLWKSAAKQ